MQVKISVLFIIEYVFIVVYNSFIETTYFEVRLDMDLKKTLTENKLRLAAAYLNINEHIRRKNERL